MKSVPESRLSAERRIFGVSPFPTRGRYGYDFGFGAGGKRNLQYE
jgi:hypothetical protein